MVAPPCSHRGLEGGVYQIKDMNKLQEKERQHTANILREIHAAMKPRKIILDSRSNNKSWFYVLMLLVFVISVGIILCFCNTPACAYTDDQLANAIYKAEGINSKYPYGIRSVSCESKEDCRKICIRTIKNNRIRYSKDVGRGDETYISYLSRKYAPLKAPNDPKGLNSNWINNVSFFLKEGRL